MIQRNRTDCKRDRCEIKRSILLFIQNFHLNGFCGFFHGGKLDGGENDFETHGNGPFVFLFIYIKLNVTQ